MASDRFYYLHSDGLSPGKQQVRETSGEEGSVQMLLMIHWADLYLITPLNLIYKPSPQHALPAHMYFYCNYTCG